MAKKADDRSEQHLDWLLRSRAKNMESTKKLFLLISSHRSDLTADVWLQEIAQELSGIAFSLWRSVFLSDLDGDITHRVADVEEFLGNLISNNTIAYPQDKNTKEFTFRYYLRNAQQRLSALAGNAPRFVQKDWDAAPLGIKNDWTAAQAALDKAIVEFDLTLGELG